MSFDEYVNHVSQKYRIAIAISVIKTKPRDLSTEEYLAHLQQKIKDMESDPNETVCSDDFNFDDDECMDQNQREIPKTTDNRCEFDYKSNKTLINSFINKYFQDDSQSSQTILNNFVFEGDAGVNVHVPNFVNNSENSLNLLRAATDGAQANNQTFENHQNLSQLTYCESQELNVNHDYNNIPTINCNTANNKHDNAMENNEKCLTNIDSQETELYSLEAFTQSYTHVSQTQDEPFIISNKFLRGKVNNYQAEETTQDIARAIDNEIENNKMTIGSDDREHSQNMATEYNYKRTLEPIANYNEIKLRGVNEKEHNCNDVEIQYDYSQLRITNDYELVHEGTEHNHFMTNKATECININDHRVTASDIEEVNNKDNYIIIELGKVNEVYKKHTNDNEQLAEDDEIEIEDFEDNTDMEVDEKASDENSQAVKVPFKVLEELHRVKAYLNRKDRKYTDGYSTDSGYRSDSQIRGSLKSLSQSSVVRINQSAHCLFSYIMEAPTGCADIAKEISQALGRLIDKLHDEENYPPFLEELLAAVDGLIRELHENSNWAEDALITKDEATHRLLLLNKSKHIQKHSIANLTDILEKLHTDLTQDEQYEITHTTQIENTSYIFHILEILLKRYIKAKGNLSQESTQNSQEDVFPKRSSLTELWRKKWNPNYKEMSLFQEDVAVCVLKKCGDVLNKIIVDCMDGYSLVSFAALQCFNSIQ